LLPARSKENCKTIDSYKCVEYSRIFSIDEISGVSVNSELIEEVSKLNGRSDIVDKIIINAWLKGDKELEKVARLLGTFKE
jgi:hypothetical protein